MVNEVQTPKAMVRGRFASAIRIAVEFKSTTLKVKRDSNGNTQEAIPTSKTNINMEA